MKTSIVAFTIATMTAAVASAGHSGSNIVASTTQQSSEPKPFAGEEKMIEDPAAYEKPEASMQNVDNKADYEASDYKNGEPCPDELPQPPCDLPLAGSDPCPEELPMPDNAAAQCEAGREVPVQGTDMSFCMDDAVQQGDFCGGDPALVQTGTECPKAGSVATSGCTPESETFDVLTGTCTLGADAVCKADQGSVYKCVLEGAGQLNRPEDLDTSHMGENGASAPATLSSALSTAALTGLMVLMIFYV